MIRDENRVMIVLNIMNGNQDRVKILCVQYREWKQGSDKFQRKNSGEFFSLLNLGTSHVIQHTVN